MKKIILVTVFVLAAMQAQAYTFTGLPWEASKPYMETAGRNYLPWNAAELEERYGVTLHIFRFPAKSKIESSRMAAAYYDAITKTAEDKILLIWVSKNKDDGIIMASDALKKTLPEGFFSTMQEDVLRPLSNRWYLSEQRLYAKILGTILYVYKKPYLNKRALEDMKGRFVNIDDPLYKISQHQPFYDLVRLFYFEPISFCMYFPFIMYAFIVRLIGMSFGKSFYLFFNLLWAALTGFIFILIINRVSVLFAEYVGLFSFFMGLNLPLYMMLYILYKDRVEAAAYSYLYEMTGGFGANSTFGGSK